MRYIEELFDYNKDKNGVIVIANNKPPIKSPEELKDYLLARFNQVAIDNTLLEFDLEEFMYDVCNINLDMVLAKVMELTEYTELISKGCSPTLSVAKLIIKRYIKTITKLVNNQKGGN